MRKTFTYATAIMLFVATSARAQAVSLEQQLRAELEKLKAHVQRVEALLERLEKEGPQARVLPSEETLPAEVSPPAGAQPAERPRPAPALNTPPRLPPSEPRAYKKDLPRFDFLIQVRGAHFSDPNRNDTFFFRKAELGVKGYIAPNIDFSFELDLVRPEDPFRRTYIRLTQLSWLHMKLGLEKAPIGLEELTPTAQIPFVDRSEVTDRFAAAEEMGVHLESRWTRWLFQLAATNGGRRLLRDNNKQKDVTARAVWAPKHWLSFGVSTLQGRAGAARLDRERYNAEFKLGSNLTGFQSEFFRAQDAAVWSTAYYLGGHWAFPTRKSWLTHFQPVLRYEQIDRSDRKALDELRLLTFGFSLLFSEHRAKFQVNYLKDLHTGSRRDELRAQYQVEF